MLALIDGDICAYRASAAAQRSISWDGEDPQAWVNPEEALKAACETIELWISQARATKHLVCLTGDTNFRKLIYPTYKANRSGVVRPLALKHVREGIKDRYQTAIVDGLEADDLLGLMLTDPRSSGKTVCVSMDKDLLGVPGLHFQPHKHKVPVFVMEAEANKWWFQQALMGDATDGYPGCPGVGPVKAERLLEPWDGQRLDHGWMHVCGAFASRLPKTLTIQETDAQALTQLRVSRILRHGDYDKTTRTVSLWHPTTPETLSLDLLNQPPIAA